VANGIIPAAAIDGIVPQIRKEIPRSDDRHSKVAERMVTAALVPDHYFEMLGEDPRSNPPSNKENSQW
jgi:hypothetical protein